MLEFEQTASSNRRILHRGRVGDQSAQSPEFSQRRQTQLRIGNIQLDARLLRNDAIDPLE